VDVRRRKRGEQCGPIKRKVQQSNVQPRELESTAKERGSQREVRRTFKMLREV